jgi:hypothetical protein
VASIKRRADRGKRWEVRYRDPEGTQKARLFDRKVDAERFVTGVEHSMLIGGYVDPAAGKVTFQTFAEEWTTSGTPGRYGAVGRAAAPPPRVPHHRSPPDGCHPTERGAGPGAAARH